jgi:hypothetical protein
MARAAAAIQEIVGLPVRDIENMNCFRFAVVKAESILKRHSLAVCCLRRKLTRPPFSIHGDDFLVLLERLNVTKI